MLGMAATAVGVLAVFWNEVPLVTTAAASRVRARADRETMFFFTANLLVCGLHRAIIGSNWAWKRNWDINF
jgi:hypothetical protein